MVEYYTNYEQGIINAIVVHLVVDNNYSTRKLCTGEIYDNESTIDLKNQRYFVNQ